MHYVSKVKRKNPAPLAGGRTGREAPPRVYRDATGRGMVVSIHAGKSPLAWGRTERREGNYQSAQVKSRLFLLRRALRASGFRLASLVVVKTIERFPNPTESRADLRRIDRKTRSAFPFCHRRRQTTRLTPAHAIETTRLARATAETPVGTGSVRLRRGGRATAEPATRRKIVAYGFSQEGLRRVLHDRFPQKDGRHTSFRRNQKRCTALRNHRTKPARSAGATGYQTEAPSGQAGETAGE